MGTEEGGGELTLSRDLVPHVRTEILWQVVEAPLHFTVNRFLPHPSHTHICTLAEVYWELGWDPAVWPWATPFTSGLIVKGLWGIQW